MKVCKKCKAHVANKTRICGHCGADVSKAKIITSVKQNSKSTVKKNAPKSKVVSTGKSIKENVKVLNTDSNSVVKNDNKKENTFYKSNEKAEKFNGTFLTFKTCFLRLIKYLWKVLKLCGVYLYKLIVFIFQGLKVLFRNLFVLLFAFFGFLIIILKKTVYGIVWSLKKVSFSVFEVLGTVTVFIYKTFTTNMKKLSNYMSSKKKLKKAKPQELVVTTVSASEEKKPKRFGFKFAIVSTFVIVFSLAAYIFGDNIYQSLMGTTNSVVISEKATKDKVFSMGDVISYKGVNYKVVKIETSKGNNYKSPKEGNQFLVVTVYIKNNTNDKIHYSYANWTMSNSKGEEKKRIFTSINVDTALYSGNLVVGGIKTGSMVFEQPINDPKLKMNFYELKKDENGDEVIDEANRVFSVSIKVPDNAPELKDNSSVNNTPKVGSPSDDKKS